MSDAPIATETPVKLNLKDLAKPAPAVPSAPEAPAPAPEKPVSPADARKALEGIAAGPTGEATPVTQATQAEQASPAGPAGPEGKAELGPDKEKVNSLLTQGAQLLLDAGDPRVAIAAMARAAAPTPLGTELRRDVLTMIADMQGDKLPAQGRENLTKLQQEITALNLPKTDPARSEFARFLEDYSRQHPDKAVPPASIEAVRTNKLDRAQEITSVLQSDSLLAAKLHEQFKGDRTEPLANVATPDGLLKAAGIAAIPENVAKATKLLEPPRPPDPKSDRSLLDSVMPTIMTVALVSTFLSQLTGSSEGGGH